MQPAAENGPTAPAAPTSTAGDTPAQPRLEGDRPPSVGPKRGREWEEEPAVKKQANEENRARLDDVKHRRPSMSPREEFRRPSPDSRRVEERRAEEPRRPEEAAPKSDSYHPSEAAHHVQNHSVAGAPLPPMQASSTPTQEKAQPAVVPKEEPVAEQPPAVEAPAAAPAAPSEPERAARKMDVDEDYDDSGEDDKKAAPATSAANGPKPASTTEEAKPISPGSTAVNGAAAPAAKAE